MSKKEKKQNSLPTGGKKKEVSKKSIIKKILPKAAKGIVKKSEKSKKPIIKKITSKPKIGKEENKTEKIAVPVSKSEIVENKKTEKIIEGEKEVKEELSKYTERNKKIAISKTIEGISCKECERLRVQGSVSFLKKYWS